MAEVLDVEGRAAEDVAGRAAGDAAGDTLGTLGLRDRKVVMTLLPNPIHP